MNLNYQIVCEAWDDIIGSIPKTGEILRKGASNIANVGGETAKLLRYPEGREAAGNAIKAIIKHPIDAINVERKAHDLTDNYLDYSDALAQSGKEYGIPGAKGTAEKIQAIRNVSHLGTAVGGAAGGALGYGIGAIIVKYFNLLKMVILKSESAEEAYSKFEKISSDGTFMSRRKLLKIGLLRKKLEAIVKQNPPDWKEQMVKRIRIINAVVKTTTTSIGAGIGGAIGHHAGLAYAGMGA